MNNDITAQTSASKVLTDLQAARQEVQLAGRLYADQHTRVTKIAFRKAQEKEARLLKDYHNARMLQLSRVTEQMKRVQR